MSTCLMVFILLGVTYIILFNLYDFGKNNTLYDVSYDLSIKSF